MDDVNITFEQILREIERNAPEWDYPSEDELNDLFAAAEEE